MRRIGWNGLLTESPLFTHLPHGYQKPLGPNTTAKDWAAAKEKARRCQVPTKSTP